MKRILYPILLSCWMLSSVFCVNTAIKNNAIILWLENYKISIYYVVDTLLLLLFIVCLLNIGHLCLKKTAKNKFSITSFVLNAITSSLLLSLFIIKINFGYISAPNIGWFYKIPEGKTIVFPRVSKAKT